MSPNRERVAGMENGEIAEELDDFLGQIISGKVGSKESKELLEYLLVKAFWSGKTEALEAMRPGIESLAKSVRTDNG